MGFDRDRREYAGEILADAVDAGAVSSLCAECVATQLMIDTAVETQKGPGVERAGQYATNYVRGIAKCVGWECVGATLVDTSTQVIPIPQTDQHSG